MAEPILPTGAVIYTDGSARPNPGFHGSGLHGYTFVHVDEKNKPTKINAWLATDKGYVLQKDLETSAARQVSIVNYLDSFQANTFAGTNNLAEVRALSLFFEQFPEIAEQINYLHILSDSEYTINAVTKWIHGWMRNGWISSTGKPVSNREALEVLHEQITHFKDRAELNIVWLKGHNDDLGNVKADWLAGIGTNKGAANDPEVFVEISDPLRYHKADVDIHPLLGLKRIYFNTSPEFNTPGLHYQTGWSSTEYINGKRTPEASFSVVELAEPDPIIESVIEAQQLAETDFNSVVYIKTDRLRSADVYPYLRNFGRFCLAKDPRNLNMNFLDKKPVTMEVRAGELPLRSFEVLNHLEEMLMRFKDEYLSGGQMEVRGAEYRAHDVTDFFYTRGTKRVGKSEVETFTLKPEFKVGIRNTEITVTEPVHGVEKDLTLPLVFMDDIPGRNIFKNLEGVSPRVFVITWRESNKLLRYSTVIQTSDAIGIWSNYFANQIFL